MSISQRDDADYPYSPKPAAVLVPHRRSIEAAAKPRPSWRFVGKWLLRLAFAASVMMAVAMIPAGIVAYRARSQAAAIEELEGFGCHVDYLSKYLYSGPSYGVREYLRRKFGDEHFGDVFLVTAMELAPTADTRRIGEICRRFDRLEDFAISSDSFRFDQIAEWERLNHLEWLTIHSANLTDDDLVRIGQIPTLKTLYLGAPKVTSEGLRHLSSAPKLSTLMIDAAVLHGSGPADEAGLPHLDSIAIHHDVKLNNQGIVSLGPMPELTAVTLQHASAGDDAIAHLARGGKLTHVSLMDAQISDKAMEALSHCPNLASLDLTRTHVTDAGVALLTQCPSLLHLDLSETKVTGKGLSGLSGSGLTLVMNKSALTDEGLREVLQIAGLASLSLYDTKVTGSSLRGVPAAESLRMIDLSGTQLSTEGIAALAMLKIRELNLSTTGFSDQDLMLFLGADEIERIDVTTTKVTPDGLKAFYEARKQRLAAAEREESLYVFSDHFGIAEQYLPDVGMSFPGFDPSLQPDGSITPDSSEPQPQTPPPEVNPT